MPDNYFKSRLQTPNFTTFLLALMIPTRKSFRIKLNSSPSPPSPSLCPHFSKFGFCEDPSHTSIEIHKDCQAFNSTQSCSKFSSKKCPYFHRKICPIFKKNGFCSKTNCLLLHKNCEAFSKFKKCNVTDCPFFHEAIDVRMQKSFKIKKGKNSSYGSNKSKKIKLNGGTGIKHYEEEKEKESEKKEKSEVGATRYNFNISPREIEEDNIFSNRNSEFPIRNSTHYNLRGSNFSGGERREISPFYPTLTSNSPLHRPIAEPSFTSHMNNSERRNGNESMPFPTEASHTNRSVNSFSNNGFNQNFMSNTNISSNNNNTENANEANLFSLVNSEQNSIFRVVPFGGGIGLQISEEAPGGSLISQIDRFSENLRRIRINMRNQSENFSRIQNMMTIEEREEMLRRQERVMGNLENLLGAFIALNSTNVLNRLGREEKLSFEEFEKLPVFLYGIEETFDKESKNLEESSCFQTCSICLEDYKYGEVIKKLYCNHQFHEECLKDWTMQKCKCPVCKAGIKKN